MMVKPHKNIIVLPYWCQAELDRYEQIAKNWSRLTQNVSDIEVCFLLLARWDAPDGTYLLKTFGYHGETKLHRCRKPKFESRGRPTRHRVVKHMFVQAFSCVETLYTDFKGFVFWMEHDVMFTDVNWLNLLNTNWFSFRDKNDRIVLMGHYVNKDNMPHILDTNSNLKIPEHINGVACYSPSILKYIRDTNFMVSDYSFDVFLSYSIKKNNDWNYVNCSELWDHRIDYWCKPFDEFKEHNPTKILIHGLKSSDSFQYHLKKLLT
jgi:hypothetical protein